MKTTKRYGWTYSRDANSSLVVARKHSTLADAEIHYSRMRTIGGPKMIGMIRAEFDVATARKHLAGQFGAKNIKLVG